MGCVQENEANVKVVAEQLRLSIKQLCDKLKDNPNVVENMAKVAFERQQIQLLLSKGLEELQAYSKLPCITDTVLAEHHQQQATRDIVERERTTTRTVMQLRGDLKEEKEQHDKVRARGRSAWRLRAKVVGRGVERRPAGATSPGHGAMSVS